MMRSLLGLVWRGVVGLAAVFAMFRAVRARWSAIGSRGGQHPPAAVPSPPAASSIRRWLLVAVALMVIAGVSGALVVVSGLVPIKASSGHWAITAWFLQFAKRRSVSTHTLGVTAPPLDELRLVMKGAGHYDIACRPCHGSPGLDQPRVAAQMTPRPPDLRSAARSYDPEELFYIVKHGIKFTGMPAWPALHRDDEVWAMVAFLRQLPTLDERTYEELATGASAPTTTAEPIQDLVDPAPVPGAISERCGRCHGVDGLGRGTGAFPRLAGQRPAYFVATMEAYARGTRHSGIMEPVAAAIGRDEMQLLADYYARLPAAAPAANAPPPDPDLERGREIAAKGVPERLVPPCAKCHGPGAERPNPNYPRIAGQYADYIRLQLTLFKSERRGGTRYEGIMRKVARQLTEEQMRTVARYYASLPADARPVTP